MEPKIKSKLFRRLNEDIFQFDPHRDISIQPKVHYGINPLLLQIRQELYNLGLMNVQTRRDKLRELLIADFLQEEKELRQVNLAYINTQP